jgi:hypothetical protein
VFRPAANGAVTFTLSTSDGIVLFEAPAAVGVSVETGQQVMVDVDVAIDSASGAVTVVTPPVVSALQDIPAATQASIATATQQIIEVSRDVILSTTPTTPSSPPAETAPPNPPAEDAPSESEPPAAPAPPVVDPNAPFTPTENNAPVITTPPPDVTPGAGAN